VTCTQLDEDQDCQMVIDIETKAWDKSISTIEEVPDTNLKVNNSELLCMDLKRLQSKHSDLSL
jgi:hypothetical protein